MPADPRAILESSLRDRYTIDRELGGGGMARVFLARDEEALLRIGLGDTAGALDALERATDEGEIWPTYYSLSEPYFDGLRASARFAALVRRVRLEERIFLSPRGGRP